MRMTARDFDIIKAVARFGQLSSGQIQAMFFHNNASKTPLDRTLTRLASSKYLAVLERRPIGGRGAGSGQYVYQLGSAGWEVCRVQGKYTPYRVIKPHMLMIGDVFVQLQELTRVTDLALTGYATEPDTHRRVNGYEVRPDLFVELESQEPRARLSVWIEVDLGTERQRQLRDKLQRFYKAWIGSEDSNGAAFPMVVFVVPDELRRREIESLIEDDEDYPDGLFNVWLLEDVATSVSGVFSTT
ncbi:replication-relaxation family protein [uncultured Kocuria sp.]|uniref:replication-relaxation family protein n=1 Tax=uncultured Kocuria sp. TaxID=259305 RepID=UPI002608EF49|nr:replication-relaxation family protein [uncultured Kocuria sp.]